MFEKIKSAARGMNAISSEQTAKIINDIADALLANVDAILEANAIDCAAMDKDNPMFDRLLLTRESIEGIAADTRKVATLPAPCGEIIEQRTLPNQLELSKVRVPLGVVGVIYEARPNVTCDVVSLCLRSGNAVVLKGGKDADNSSRKMVEIIHSVLRANNISEDIVLLLPATHEAAEMLMNAVGYVDVLIPRGSKRLIEAVRNNAKVPVIETGAGVVHTYVDKAADIQIAAKVVCNAKTRRVSVCNALDCMIIHKDQLAQIRQIAEPLAAKNVELYADEPSYAALSGSYPAQLLHHAAPDDFGREFQSLRMAIKTVDSINEALDHIFQYSSKHSEAIITTDADAAALFLNAVDAACCYWNTSTAFSDGAQFGLGAEIGISTQKLHARGPMALKELTTYKWIIKGNGQTRS